MNINKELYNTVEAKEIGEFEKLELGGHEVVILDAREYQSTMTGNISLKISVDIGGNDKQKGFFKKQYDANTNKEKYWSNSAIKYISLKDEQLSYLKGFITALEKSSPSFKFNLNGSWEQLKNLKCAAQFGQEEYQKQDGTITLTTKLLQFRSLDKLDEIKVPDIKLLNGSFVKPEDYKKQDDLVKKATDLFGSDMVEISGSELPF